jgi:hypothetical protein
VTNALALYPEMLMKLTHPKSPQLQFKHSVNEVALIVFLENVMLIKRFKTNYIFYKVSSNVLPIQK